MKFLLGGLLGLLVSTSAFSADPRSYMPVKITSQGNNLDADVTTTSGKNRLEVNASQSGTWSVGRTWTLLNSTDSVNAVQSGTWTTGRTWVLSSATDSTASVQSGTWTTGRTWTLSSGTDSIAATQSGTWNINNISGTVSLPTGASTAAGQATGNASLSSIDGKTPALGQALMAASVPVAIASNQSAIPVTQSGTWSTGRTWTLANGTDSVAAVQSGTWTVQQGATPTTVGNAWPFKLTDGTNVTGVKAASTAAVAADPSAVVALSPNSPLPAGANNVGSITNVTGTITLPAGASTSALQTSGNASLTSIDGKTPALGQTTMAGSSPVTIASNQTSILTTATYVDVSPANQTITAFDSGTTSFTGANGQLFYTGTPTTNSAATFAISSIGEVAIQANLLGGGGTMVVEASMDGGTFWFRPNVFQISTQSYANGFTSPFAVALNTSGMTHIRVRGTISWAGTATIIVKETLNNHMVTVADALPGGANNIGSITNVTGTVSLPTGAATSALQTTANTSLASIDAGIPAALGQTTMSASMPVTIASDQSIVAVKETLTTGGVYGNLAVGTTAEEVRVGASRLTGRRNITFVVIDTQTCFWGYNSSVTTSTGTPMAQNQFWSIDIDALGSVYIICTATTKNARITESP